MIKRAYLFVLILLTIGITGCRDVDDFGGEGWKTDGKTVEITIPGKVPAITVQSRAETTPEEKQLEKVDVLVFKEETIDGVKRETFAYRVDNPTVVTENEEVLIKAKLKVSEEGESYRLVFIGNLRDELTNFLNGKDLSDVWFKDDLLEELTFDQDEKWAISSRALPMWAEATETTPITTTMVVADFGDIKFIRSVARIELSVDSGIEDKFEIKEVTVHHARNKGRAVPDPDNISNGEAILPSLATANVIDPDKMVFPVTDNELTGVYVNEADNQSDDAMFLIVKAIYKGEGYSGNTTPTYYKVRFYGADNKPKDILRNFTYNMIVTAVERPGEEDEDDAIDSDSNNLTVTMTDWSNGEMKLVVFNKQHYLAVSESWMKVPKAAATHSFYVKTNYVGGWVASVSEGGEWLTGLNPGSFNEIETLKEISFNVSENDGQERRGTISFTCGNDLTLDVYVTQTMDEGVSLKIEVKTENGEYVDIEDYENTLLFHSGNHYDITPKELKVTWTPTSENLIVVFDQSFDWGEDNDLHTIYEEDGTAYMKIVPAPMLTRPVFESDPLKSWFPFDETAIQIQVGGDSSTKQTVSVKKQHYEVYLDRAERYEMNDEIYTIMLYSNSPEWEVKFTSKGGIDNYIQILTQNPPKGGSNIENGTYKIENNELIIEDAGEAIRFQLKKPGSGSINAEVNVKITYDDDGEEMIKEYVFRAYYEDGQSQFIAGGDANCYMLQPNGKKIHIPVSQANRSTMLGEQIKEGDQLTATFIWTDHPGGLGKLTGESCAVYEINVINNDGPNSILEVTPGDEEGNAVVGIKNAAGDILWSWHLWVSNFDPNNQDIDRYEFRNYQFLDRNLGALTDDPKDPKSFGLFYQWGRKDPFPSAKASKSTEFIPIYNEKGKERGGEIYMTKINRTSLGQSEWSNGVHFLEEATRYPLQFIMSTEWWCTGSLGNYLNEAAKFWSENESGDIANAKKGVFDPCPDGWKTVPASTSNASEWYKLFSVCKYESEGHYAEVHNPDYVNLGKWPFVGQIGCSDGAISGVETGRYWTGNKDAWGSPAIHSYFTNNSNVAHPAVNHQASFGLPVRCMRRIGDTR